MGKGRRRGQKGGKEEKMRKGYEKKGKGRDCKEVMCLVLLALFSPGVRRIFNSAFLNWNQ